MGDKITAPWTADQVAALNRFQVSGFVHEFTCINDHGTASRVLIAHSDGWHCPTCAYQQNWAHGFMLLEPVDPFAGILGRPTEGR
ncbi:hypothetical protein ACVIGB_000458 [Bradyrhizobium sp. USDA 4341]